MRVLATAAAALLATASYAAMLDAPPPDDTRAALRQDAPPAYWLKINGQDVGPLPLEMVKTLAAAAQFTLETEVWTAGSQAWKPAADYAEVAALFAAAPAVAEPAVAAEPAANGGGAGQQDGQPVVVPAGEPQAEDPPPPPPVQNEEVPPPPPVQNAAELIKYFVAADGKTTGPFTIDEMKAKVIDGSLTTITTVWKKGQAGWEPAEKLPELAVIFADTPKPPPFDCARFIVGVWQKSVMYSGTQISTVSQFERTGQFSSVQTMYGIGSTSYGTWNATTVGEKSCSVTLNTKYPTTAQSTVVFDVQGQGMLVDKSDNSQIVRLQ